MILILIVLGFGVLGYVVSSKLKSKFNKYSQISLKANLSGKEVAELMLADNNVANVTVNCVEGQLSDHYNPANRTVNLSPDVYYGRNAAATAVAAHECGHAIQHATSYAWLSLRSALVPIQNASGKILNIVLIGAIFGGIALFGLPYAAVCAFVDRKSTRLNSSHVLTPNAVFCLKKKNK